MKIGYIFAVIYILVLLFCGSIGLCGMAITFLWPPMFSFFTFLFGVSCSMIVIAAFSIPLDFVFLILVGYE